jgi:hypothetical protein
MEEKKTQKLIEAPKEISYEKPKVLKPRAKFRYAEVVRKLEHAFSIGCTISEACLYAEISRDTYYRWINNNQTLKDRFDALLEKPLLRARSTVVNNLDDPKVAAWYLEKKKRAEFGTMKEEDRTKEIKKIEVEFKDFSDEDITK